MHPDVYKLSIRIRQVLYGISNDMTIKEIALWLGRSNKDIEYHSAHLRDITGVHNYAGLTKLAVKLGLANVKVRHHPRCSSAVRCHRTGNRCHWSHCPQQEHYQAKPLKGCPLAAQDQSVLVPKACGIRLVFQKPKVHYPKPSPPLVLPILGPVQQKLARSQ